MTHPNKVFCRVCPDSQLSLPLEATASIIEIEDNALRWTLNQAEATWKLGIRQLKLTELDVDIVNCAGKKIQAAYALSILINSGTDNIALE